jgi:hypothetical protein
MSLTRLFRNRTPLANQLTGEKTQPTSHKEIALRFCLCAIAVVVCYQFDWGWLRYLTSESQMRLDALLGMPHQRVAQDTLLWKGTLYQYVNACTFVDVWFGAIPLMWNTRRTVWANIGRAIVLALVLFVFNVSRLTFSNVLFNAGINWDLAHNVVGGFCYFAVWVWLWNHAGWKGHVHDEPIQWNPKPELSSATR